MMQFLPVAADQANSAVDGIDHPFDGFADVGMPVLPGALHHLSLNQHVAQTG